MKRKAFTLIEAMVVLSVLAIISILAYNFFGNTIKEAKYSQAATKIFKDLNSLVSAYELHLKDGRAAISGTHQLQNADFYNLVSNGYLRQLPQQDQAYEWTGMGDYRFSSGINYGGKSGAADVSWMMYFQGGSRAETDGICELFNERYSSLGKTSPTAIQYNQGAYCYNLGSGHSFVRAIYVIFHELI